MIKRNIIFTATITFVIMSCSLCSATTTKHPPSLSFVLTNNPGKSEPGLDIGCTYKATNPKDSKKTEQVVIFDLKTHCRIDMVAMLFSRSQKPASVEVFVSDTVEGPWKPVGKILKEKQTAEWWKTKLNKVSGRYVKLFQKADKGSWYLREVKLYGNVLTNSPEKAKVINGKLNIIKNGKSFSTIVISDKAPSRVLEAATAFQRVANRMTGAWVPIVLESNFDGKSTPIYIGDSAAVRKRGIKVKQNASDGDHYIIRRGKNYLALVGNDASEYSYRRYRGRFLRSSVYAVYHLFEKLGCGWFGPDSLWQVIPATKILSIPALNINERPAFLSRYVGMDGMKSKELRDAWREGGMPRCAGRHAYYEMVPPQKYKKQHPDWFGKGQPDITNPEVIKIVIANLRKKIDKVPSPLVVPFSFSSNDWGGYAVNERTKKIGNISAQQLYFANEVAKGLNKTHRGRFRLYCLAYWHSHHPPIPMLKAEPGVHVAVVNEGNHTKPLDMLESKEEARTNGRSNTRVIKSIEGWKKTGALTGIYEWYIPVLSNRIWRALPWQPGELSLRNLRYWYSKGIRFVYYESQGEKNGGFPLRWPVYYQCYRGMWNPKLTAKEIMTEACGKLFGPAGKAMMNYYAVFEKAMLKTNVRAGNWHLPRPFLVYTPKVEKEADKWLAEASSKAVDELAKKRIAEEKSVWETAKNVMSGIRNNTFLNSRLKVFLDGKKKYWRQQFITREIIISLYDLSGDAEIDVIEKDGQNRRLLPKEKVDLTQGVVFQRSKNGQKHRLVNKAKVDLTKDEVLQKSKAKGMILYSEDFKSMKVGSQPDFFSGCTVKEEDGKKFLRYDRKGYSWLFKNSIDKYYKGKKWLDYEWSFRFRFTDQVKGFIPFIRSAGFRSGDDKYARIFLDYQKNFIASRIHGMPKNQIGKYVLPKVKWTDKGLPALSLGQWYYTRIRVVGTKLDVFLESKGNMVKVYSSDIPPGGGSIGILTYVPVDLADIVVKKIGSQDSL